MTEVECLLCQLLRDLILCVHGCVHCTLGLGMQYGESIISTDAYYGERYAMGITQHIEHDPNLPSVAVNIILASQNQPGESHF